MVRQFEAIKAAAEAALVLLRAPATEPAPAPPAPEPEPPGCAHRRRERVSGFGPEVIEFCHDCCRMLRDGQVQDQEEGAHAEA